MGNPADSIQPDGHAAAELLDRGFRYALALTHHREDAEDVVQEAWLSLHRRYGEIRSPRLLFTTIKHLVIDQQRRSRVVRFEPAEHHDSPAAPIPMAQGTQEDMWALLGQLRESEREALFLHHIEGHTAAEIGRLTSRSRNTVLSLLNRGMSKLRQLVTARPSSTADPFTD